MYETKRQIIKRAQLSLSPVERQEVTKQMKEIDDLIWRKEQM